MAFADGHNRAAPPREPEPQKPTDLKPGDYGFREAVLLADSVDLDKLAGRIDIIRANDETDFTLRDRAIRRLDTVYR